jgi:hypothetical protein
MFEQDFIMRLIEQMIRSIMKLIFKMEYKNIEEVKFEDSETEAGYNILIQMADKGEINAAENKLYEDLDTDNIECLKAGLLFYEHLNEFNLDTLKNYDFYKEEIKEGVARLLKRYGYEGLDSVFIV